ncbi:MAG TPA: PH domain-containing protein [Rhizomicrobium sp.]|nr:PH domain-containing protein [Rhizomicrobium sp.]
MASYVSKVLQPNETVRYDGTLHWIIYLPGIVLFAFGIAGLIGVLTLAHAAPGYRIYSVVVYIALGVGALLLLSSWIRQQSTEIAVTDRRVIYKTGLVSRRTVEMNMDKVESVDVTQSIWGRIFNFGTVLIRGTGASLEPLATIATPLALRNAITAR